MPALVDSTSRRSGRRHRHLMTVVASQIQDRHGFRPANNAGGCASATRTHFTRRRFGDGLAARRRRRIARLTRHQRLSLLRRPGCPGPESSRPRRPGPAHSVRIQLDLTIQPGRITVISASRAFEKPEREAFESGGLEIAPSVYTTAYPAYAAYGLEVTPILQIDTTPRVKTVYGQGPPKSGL